MTALPLLTVSPSYRLDEGGEEWRPVTLPGAEAYQVSSRGRIRNICTGRELHAVTGGTADGRRYRCRVVFIMCAGRNVGRTVGSLVAAAFLGPKPPLHRLMYRDDDPTNPVVTNLQYIPFASSPRKQRLVSSSTSTSAKPSRGRRGNVDVASVPDGNASMLRGLDARPVTCPRCDAVVEHEPAFVHCRMCGRLFPLRGAPLCEQVAFERASAMATETQLMRPSAFHRPVRTSRS